MGQGMCPYALMVSVANCRKTLFRTISWSISPHTIYRAIYAGKFDEPGLSHGNRGAIRKLRHRGKSRHTKGYVERRGKIQISNELETRPIEVNNRTRLGDWEGDTVAVKRSEDVKNAAIDLLKGEPLNTITPDRGKEFSKHAEIAEALDKVAFYFSKPAHPWDRGSNETRTD